MVLAATAILACADDSGAPGAVPSVELVATDTLVTTASALIGGAYDLSLSPDGDLYVADYGFKHVLVVGPDGAVRRTIGQQGSGPGEFEMPYVLHAGADSVWVLDATSNRVQVFDRGGRLARGYQVEAPGIGAGRAFRDDGTLAASIDGFDSAMVAVLDPAGTRIATFGDPIVPPVSFFDFAAIKSEIRDGRVPNAMRNRATPVWAADHSLYLVFSAEAQVRRYDSAGNLVWTRVLDEPVLRAAREAFVRKNIEEQNPSRFHSLQYVSDAAVVDDDLWLLLNTADQHAGLLLVLRAEDGAPRQRIAFPGLPNTGRFVIDQMRRRLYMAPQGEASVLIFALPAP